MSTVDTRLLLIHHIHQKIAFLLHGQAQKSCFFVNHKNAAFKAILDLYTLATRFQITAYINTNGQHGHSIVLN